MCDHRLLNAFRERLRADYRRVAVNDHFTPQATRAERVAQTIDAWDVLGEVIKADPQARAALREQTAELLDRVDRNLIPHCRDRTTEARLRAVSARGRAMLASLDVAA